MNTNEVIQNAVQVSDAVRDAVLSSLSWSGGSRTANAIINNEADPLAEKMARLVCLVNTPRLKPSTDEVIDLLLAKPRKNELSQADIDVLIDAGETLESIDATLEQDYQSALDRHEVQAELVKNNEDAIRAKLDKLYSAKTAQLPDFPEMADVKQRVISKVAKRKPNLIRDLSYGNITGEQLKAEMFAIKDFMKKVA